jgi:hypothetical protein
MPSNQSFLSLWLLEKTEWLTGIGTRYLQLSVVTLGPLKASLFNLALTPASLSMVNYAKMLERKHTKSSILRSPSKR